MSMSTTAERIAEWKRRIEVMEAAERGEPIRHMAIQNSVTGWCDTKEFRWDWEKFVYEVKPKPREWWVNMYCGMSGRWHKSKELADDVGKANRDECRHVIEVIEP